MRVGIDLGTTYSAVAYVDSNGKATIIKNEMNENLTPSIIAFDGDDVLYGESARQVQALGSKDVVSAFKRRIGTNTPIISYGSRDYNAEDLSSMLLKHMVACAENRMGQKIDSAVITVPAYFNNPQRESTMRAGERAGLKVLKIVNEPTAAAFSYGMSKYLDGKMMVFDLGGGTFDITIFQVSEGKIDVIATSGNSTLGGKNWDHALLNYVSEKFMEEYGIDPREDESFMSEFIVESERYKNELSVAESVRVRIDYGGYRGNYSVSRSEFESLTKGLVDFVIQICENLLKEIDYTWNSFNSILLTGGATRIPSVREAIKNCTDVPVIIHEDTDLAVAKGAALFAEAAGESTIKRIAGGKDNTDISEMIHKKRIIDVTAHSLGTVAVSPDETRYINEIMLRRNSKIPCSFRKRFEIKPGNMTDKLEIYTLQGEEIRPLDCTILAKVTASGIRNNGSGVSVDIEFCYNENGIVEVKAYQDNTPLTIVSDPIPDDVSWMGKPPEKPKVKYLPIHICMSIDLSGSMCTDNAKEKAVDAMSALVRKLPEARFSITEFGTTGAIILREGSSSEALNRMKSIPRDDVGGGTSYSPFSDIHSCLGSERSKYKRIAIVLTDGCWYSSNEDPVAASKKCMKDGIDVIAVGFADADENFLRKISNADIGGLTKLSQLTETFSTIATAIGSDGLRRR